MPIDIEGLDVPADVLEEAEAGIDEYVDAWSASLEEHVERYEAIEDPVGKIALPTLQKGSPKVDHARRELQNKIGGWLRRACDDYVRALESHAHKKIAKADDDASDEDFLVSLFDPDWASLAHEIEDDLEDIAADGGYNALAQISLAQGDMLSGINLVARDWAKERAAELVGMRRLADGSLVPNPNAKYRIDDTTRDEIRRVVREAFEEQTSIKELISDVKDSGAFSDSRAKMIAVTEASRAETAGNLAGWKASGIVETVRVVLSADHDPESECDCEDIADAGPYEISDAPELPVHPNCLVGNAMVSASGVAAHSKRWFEGEIIVIRIPGHELRVTPNHPILTQRGWLPAGDLKIGDNVFQCVNPERAVRAINPNDHYVETMIEQIANSRLMSGGMLATSVPSSAETFHGDGSAYGEIEIVWTDGKLARERELHGSQSTFDSSFGARGFARSEFDAFSFALEKIRTLLFTAYGVVRSLSMRCALLWRELGASHEISFALAPYGEAVRSEVSDDNPVINESIALRDRQRAFPGQIGSVHGRDLAVRETSRELPSLMKCTDMETKPSHSFADLARHGISDPLGDVVDRLSGLMRLVQLVHVERVQAACHVYNLETDIGFYFAETIVAHNCMCGLVIDSIAQAA